MTPPAVRLALDALRRPAIVGRPFGPPSEVLQSCACPVRPFTLLLLVALLATLAVIAPARAGQDARPQRVRREGLHLRGHALADHEPRRHVHGPPPAGGDAQRSGRRRQDQGVVRRRGHRRELQPFTYVRRGVTYNTQNVVAFLPADQEAGEPTPLVIVGAHYDCVTAGAGADDNASGVAVMLEVAAAHREVQARVRHRLRRVRRRGGRAQGLGVLRRARCRRPTRPAPSPWSTSTR